ncbi:MAG: hypothetical protein M1830_010161 [Pleopsidium flavum]|nr:MAG: hypothetical protein M1830_010161 [Pleopsidium flavum]
MLLPLSAFSGLFLALKAAEALTLGSTAAGQGVCAATTITSTGNTVIHGGISLNPGTAITGFTPGIATSTHINDATAKACKSQALSTYNQGIALAATKDLTGQDLGGQTLVPGVYKYSSSAQLTGTLTLNGRGRTNSQFVFQIGSTLTTATAAKIVLTNGAKACNVFFLIGSSATIGETSRISGIIIALTSITVNNAVVDNGGFYALNAAVTLIDDDITPPGVC